MKKRILSVLIVIMLLCTGVLFAGGEQEQPEQVEKTADVKPEATTRTIVDDLGREVTLAKPAERIAFSHFSTGEALKIVDAWDKVVGIDGFTFDNIVFPNLDTLPRICKMPYSLNYEEVFALEVDLFIVPKVSMGGLDQMIEQLEPDIPVAVLNFQDPASFEESLRKLGVLLGKEEAAAEYLEWYGKVISSISERTSNLKEDELTTYFQKLSYSGSIVTFTNAKAGIPLRNKITGSINVAADIPAQDGWVQSVDPEWLATQNIDVVFSFDFVQDGYGIGLTDNTVVKEYREAAIKDPVLANTEAVKQGRYYMITSKCWSSPRNIIGFAYMAKWFHPELFEDFDPKTIHQEYLTRFMDVDCDLDTQGVFVYPEE